MEAEPALSDEGMPTESTQDQKKKRPARDAQPIRTELVARIRQEIAAGTYDTQEKWEAALDRLLDRLESE
jgi:anti-sigma28 factor (negative regulator of flagellin synthesis)